MPTSRTIASSLLAESQEAVRRAYGWAIGCGTSELVTPALVLDLAGAKSNIERMADHLGGAPASIRPHFKAHKSPDLARLQAAGGAIGFSAATVWEALVLIAAGLDHIFVVNEVVDREKIDLLVDQARTADLMVAVDDAGNVDDLAAAALRAGSRLGVLVDVDTGMGRCGVRSADEAIRLASRVSGSISLDFRGVTGYEGHCSRTPDRRLRHRLQVEATAMLVDVATRVEAAGMPCPIRSAGGTATWEWTARDPGITEIQAGSYVVMDRFHGAMVSGFDHSLRVLATVVSARTDRVIVNAGNKSVGMGEVASIVGHPNQPILFSEEHGIFQGPRPPNLTVGNKVEIVPGYSPTTVNLFDAYHVVDEGVVVDIWPIVPRGPGHHGLVDAQVSGRT